MILGVAFADSWHLFPALRCRFRNRFHTNRVRTSRSVNAIAVCRCRGGSAAGPGGRPASFPPKRVDGAPGVLAIAKRKNRTIDPIWTDQLTATANLSKRRTLFLRKLRSSYGILTDERTFATDNGDTDIRRNGNVMLETTHEVPGTSRHYRE